MKIKNIIQGLVFFLTSLLLFFFLIQTLLPVAPHRMTRNQGKEPNQALHYVAVGDSLTEGVGDTSNQGGFVPLLSQSLTNHYSYEVTAVNYGVSGNTSAQILSRMKKKKEIQQDVKQAQLMTLTVGGNDLRNAVIEHLTDFDMSDLTTPMKDYKENLIKIIDLARKENPQLPIYILGIYNPFYLNFSEIREIQEVVDDWNQLTEETISSFKGVYFVPVNDLLYKGIDGNISTQETEDGRTIVVNDALYAEDRFHPNHTGYEKIAEAMMQKIAASKKEWKK